MGACEMDFKCYPDVTEIALDNFKIEKNYRNEDTVLKMFIAIGDLIYDCLDTEGYIQTNNFLVDGSDAVYRRLKVIEYFLTKLDPFYLLCFQHFNRVKVNEIKWVVKKILVSIKPQYYNDSQLENEFKFKDVYLLSHKVAYVSIGTRLCIIADFLTHLPDLTEWRPYSVLRYHASLIEDVQIKSSKKVIIISRRDISVGEMEFRKIARMEVELFCLRDVEIPSMESFDWTFEELSSFTENPLVYVYSVCNTVEKLLKVASYFHRKIAAKSYFTHLSILWIFKMCNALLLKGYFRRNDLTLVNMLHLLNVIFSVMDRLLIPALITAYSNENFIREMFNQFKCVWSIFFKYENLFLQHNHPTFPNYNDVLYKFILMYFHQYRHELPDLNIGELKTTVLRPFLPNEIGSKKEQWILKFKECSNIAKLLISCDELCCSICQKEFEWKKTEIAILERCNHLCCLNCLLEKLNVIGDLESEIPLESFDCPKTSCDEKHTGFTTDDQYDRIVEETLGDLQQGSD